MVVISYFFLPNILCLYLGDLSLCKKTVETLKYTVCVDFEEHFSEIEALLLRYLTQLKQIYNFYR